VSFVPFFVRRFLFDPNYTVGIFLSKSRISSNQRICIRITAGPLNESLAHNGVTGS
jgi:hypothetical protein